MPWRAEALTAFAVERGHRGSGGSMLDSVEERSVSDKACIISGERMMFIRQGRKNNVSPVIGFW